MATRVTGRLEALHFGCVSLVTRFLRDAFIALTRRSMTRATQVCIASTTPPYNPSVTMLGSVDTAELHFRR